MSDRIAFTGKVTTEGRRLRGSVQLAGQRTFRNNEWLEVDPAALVKADASDVLGRIDHDPSKVFARTKNGSLSITRTDQGIDWESADLPNTSYANDALELAREGLLSGSSFEIEVARSKFETDPDGTRVRRITSIKRLVDVAPVFDPAFSSTTAAFKKESDMSTETETPVEEPKAPPAPAIQLAEQPKSGAEKWEAFARDISTDQIEATLDNLMAETKGDLRGDEADRFEGFAQELQRRQRESAETKARIERMQFQHKAVRGLITKAPETGLLESDDYREAFSHYLRTGNKSGMEQFAQSIAGDGSEGGYTVPDGFLNRITETLKAYGGIAGVADSITTSDGQPLRWPSNDDTANSAAIATEGAAVASGGADKVFGSITLGAWSYDATGANNLPLLVSKELLQDSAFDIEAFIARNLSERLGRKMAADFATGVGTTEPLGLFAKTPDAMTATTMYAALVEHMFQVDQAYRESGNARWVLGDTVLAKIFGSVDGNGRPLFIPSSEASGAGRPAGFLLGYPVTLDQGSAGLVAFGDIRRGYIIRYVRGVQVDVDPYTNIKSRQVAYHAWARADANVQDSSAYSVSDYASVNADAVPGG